MSILTWTTTLANEYIVKIFKIYCPPEELFPFFRGLLIPGKFSLNWYPENLRESARINCLQFKWSANTWDECFGRRYSIKPDWILTLWPMGL